MPSKHAHTHKVRVEREAEMALTQPHAKGRQELPAPVKLEEARKHPQGLWTTWPCSHFLLGLQASRAALHHPACVICPKSRKERVPLQPCSGRLGALGFYTKGWRLMPFIVELPSCPHVQPSLTQHVRWPHSPPENG